MHRRHIAGARESQIAPGVRVKEAVVLADAPDGPGVQQVLGRTLDAAQVRQQAEETERGEDGEGEGIERIAQLRHLADEAQGDEGTADGAEVLGHPPVRLEHRRAPSALQSGVLRCQRPQEPLVASRRRRLDGYCAVLARAALRLPTTAVPAGSCHRRIETAITLLPPLLRRSWRRGSRAAAG